MRRLALLAAAVLLVFLAACRGGPVRPGGYSRSGRASYYAERHHGRRTASGARFDMYAYTAAHRRLPFGTRVRVTNLRNGRSVVVTINDRGPHSGGRIIDVSWAAARDLRILAAGSAPVRLEVLR